MENPCKEQGGFRFDPVRKTCSYFLNSICIRVSLRGRLEWVKVHNDSYQECPTQGSGP